MGTGILSTTELVYRLTSRTSSEEFPIKLITTLATVPLCQSKDFVGGITIMDGRIPVSDPMFIFHEDMKFAYNGEFYERDILMGFFVTQIPSKTDENFLWNIVSSLTASQ